MKNGTNHLKHGICKMCLYYNTILKLNILAIALVINKNVILLPVLVLVPDTSVNLIGYIDIHVGGCPKDQQASH